MKVILDEGMPLRAAAAMRDLGVDTSHVLERGMCSASDEDIVATAFAENAVVVTLDADFHQLLAASGALAPSVIRVRIEGLQSEALALLLVGLLRRAGDALRMGAVVSVDSRSVRLRRLPIGHD